MPWSREVTRYRSRNRAQARREGVKVCVHYYRNEAAANDTLEEIRKRGSDGFIVQANVCLPDEISRMFAEVNAQFGGLEILVSNARPEASEFFQAPMDITLKQWDAAFDSQANAFLIAVREASALMLGGGTIIAITYAQGSRTGGLLPWVGMGSAKAALESMVRYFAVALAKRGITVNAISPGWTENSVLNSLPEQVQELIRNWHKRGWTPMGRLGTPEDIGDVVTLFCSEQAVGLRDRSSTRMVARHSRSTTGNTVRVGSKSSLAVCCHADDILRGSGYYLDC